jgi:hypothetical protein
MPGLPMPGPLMPGLPASGLLMPGPLMPGLPASGLVMPGLPVPGLSMPGPLGSGLGVLSLLAAGLGRQLLRCGAGPWPGWGWDLLPGLASRCCSSG